MEHDHGTAATVASRTHTTHTGGTAPKFGAGSDSARRKFVVRRAPAHAPQHPAAHTAAGAATDTGGASAAVRRAAYENVALVFDPARDARSRVPYYLQGNPLLETPEMKAKRHALKADRAVLQAINKLATLFRTDADGLVQHDEYVAVHAKLLRALIPSYTGDILAAAEEDWDLDRAGAPALDRNALIEALFSLVDTWTISITPEEYVAFVDALMARAELAPAPAHADPYSLLSPS